jgi:hypothetical protein
VGLGGVKAWRWHLEELGRGGGAAESGEWRWQCGRAWAAQEVEETADMQGPLVSDMRERERARLRLAFWLNGLSGVAAAYEGRRDSTRRVGPAGLDPREISNGKTDFKIN